MANICHFEVHVRGPKPACELFYMAQPLAEDPWDEEEKDLGNGEIVYSYKGGCKWSLDAYCNTKIAEGEQIPLPPEYIQKHMGELAQKYYYLPFREKARLFGVDVEAYSEDEGEFMSFESYDRLGKSANIDTMEYAEECKEDFLAQFSF